MKCSIGYTAQFAYCLISAYYLTSRSINIFNKWYNFSFFSLIYKKGKQVYLCTLVLDE